MTIQNLQTSPERSKLMRKIKSKNTKSEVLFRKELWLRGFRYRINVKQLPGRPDIYLSKYRLAIFIDGEFWHGYNWIEKKDKIKSNRHYWIPKIEKNMLRDTQNNIALENQGIKVMRFWDGEIKNKLDECLERVLEFIYYNQ